MADSSKQAWVDAVAAGETDETYADWFVRQERGPVRVQLSRRKGWRMPENTVKVTRPGKWGNPFDFRKSECCWIALSFGCRGDRLGRQEASVRAFRDWIAPGVGKRTVSVELQPSFGNEETTVPVGPKIEAGIAPELDDVAKELRGWNLACWCRLCPEHAAGKPFDVTCAACDPCHSDVLGSIANFVCEAAIGAPPESTDLS